MSQRKQNLSLRQWIYSLPQPHRDNIWHSLSPTLKLNNQVYPSIISAVCMVDPNNGFSPPKYYQDLFNQLNNECKRD